MEITTFGHSCLLLSYPSARILIDPGTFSSGFEGVTGLDAIIVTHQHPDHLDPQRFTELVTANPGAVVLTEPSVAAMLADGELPAGPGHTALIEALTARAFTPSEHMVIGDVTLSANGGKHATIHADLPQVGNVGVLFTASGEPTLFHPGDSLDVTPPGVDILAVPVSAPWCAAKETIDFVRAVGAPQSVAIHDKTLSAGGRGIYLGHIERLGGTELIQPHDGQTSG